MFFLLVLALGLWAWRARAVLLLLLLVTLLVAGAVVADDANTVVAGVTATSSRVVPMSLRIHHLALRTRSFLRFMWTSGYMSWVVSKELWSL